MEIMKLQSELIRELKIKTVKKEHTGNLCNIKHITECYDINGNLEMLLTENSKTEYLYIDNLLVAEKCIENGDVVEITSYMYEDNKKIIIVDGFKKCEKIYKNNLLFRKISYIDKDTTIITNYKYDKNNNLIEEDSFNSIIKYKYNENNKLISKILFIKSSLPYDGIETIYDYNDNIMILKFYNGYKTEYRFNDNKLLECIMYYNPDGIIEDECKYTYEFHK